MGDSFFFIWPESEEAISSGDLLGLCKKQYAKLFPEKDFSFNRYRQFIQTVFAQTCNDDRQKTLFNRIMQHG